MPRKTTTRRNKRNLDPLTAMSLAQTTGADKALLGRKGFAALTDKRTYLGTGRNPTDPTDSKPYFALVYGYKPTGNDEVLLHRTSGFSSQDDAVKSAFKKQMRGESFSQIAVFKRYKGTDHYADLIGGSRLHEERKRNPDDIEFLNDMAPQASLGHIEFTQDGIERYMRGGYIYQAFTSTPVFEDGYRMGSVEETVDQFAQANPAKYERCVKAVQARGGANGYAVCTAAGTRSNPHHAEGQYLGTDGNFEYWEWRGQVYRNRADNSGRGYMIDPVTSIALREGDTGGIPSGVRSEGSIDHFNRYIKSTLTNPHSRRRQNPEDTSDSAYESFHGAPPSETLELRESLHVHGHLWAIGDLVHLVVTLTAGQLEGDDKQLNAPDPLTSRIEDIVRLTANENRSQLYFSGGDQSLSLKGLGFRESYTITHDGEDFDATDYKDLMEIGRITRVMYRTEKAFDDFEEIDYHHLHGEDTKKYPLLLYDTMNSRLVTAGGEYAISPEGIVN